MKIKLFVNNTTLDATKDMISAIDNSDFSFEHIIIVPDKFSLQMEKLLLSLSPNESLFNVNVVGLTSFANQIFKKLNKKIELLSNSESLLITETAIQNVKNQLKFFCKKDISFCFEVDRLIAQIKSSCIDSFDLELLSNKNLNEKYNDICLIFKEYQKLLGDKLDENERLRLLCETLLKNDILKNTKIYFAQFDSFTAEGYLLIKTLIQCAYEVNISLTQPLSIGNDYIYEKDIYYKITKLSNELNCSFDVINKNLISNSSKYAIVKGLYSYEKLKCENKGFYNLFSVNSIVEEVEDAAKTIYYFLNKGVKYKDIVVMTSNLEKYKNQVENVFSRYEFPYYIDSSISADKTLLGNLINMFFDTYIMNYPYDRLVSLFSNILVGKDDSLIKICQLYSISGKQRYKKYLSKLFPMDFIFKNLDKANTSEDFSKIILSICKEVEKNFDDVIFKMNEFNLVKEKNINLQVYDIIKEVVSLIERYQTNEISVSEYIKKFKLLMSFKQVSTVPSYCDGIFIGDATNSSSLNSKIMIILGGQDLPLINSDNGILSDEELKVKFNNKIIEPTIRMINRRNRFKLFNLLSQVDKKLLIFYHAINEEGKKNEIPAYIDSLNNIFDVHPIKASLIFDSLDNSNLEKIKIALGNKKNFIEKFYNKVTINNFNQFGSISVDEKNKLSNKNYITINPTKLYFDKDYVRVTQLEQYFSCPFKHFLTYGLKLKEKESFEFDARDLGNICHKGAQMLINTLINKGYKCDFDLEKYTDGIFDQILLEENLKEKIENSQEKYWLAKFIKKQLNYIFYDIIREVKQSLFKPKFLEMKFENIFLGNQSPIRMVGKADRIDTFNNKYFRIIDYKTGSVGNVLKELYFGNKLQLFLYQRAVKEKIKLLPAGVFYFNAKFDYAQNDEDKVVLKGLIEDFDEILKLYDKNLINLGKSTIVGLEKKLNSKEKEVFSGVAIAKDSLKTYEKYAFAVSNNAVDEIQNGYIEPKPKEKACEFCPYLSICRYERNNGERNTKIIGDFNLSDETKTN